MRTLSFLAPSEGKWRGQFGRDGGNPWPSENPGDSRHSMELEVLGRAMTPTTVEELPENREGGGTAPVLTAGSPNEARMAGLGIRPNEGRE